MTMIEEFISSPTFLATGSVLLLATVWVITNGDSYEKGGTQTFGSRVQELWYLWKVRIQAIRSLCRITPGSEAYQKYLDSYVLFDGDWSTKNGKKEEQLVHYYDVINHICALGNVEKMYIPPLMDENASLFHQQILCEEKLFRDMGAGPGMKCIDLGCGRGCVAMHCASKTGCHMTGMNIDPGQLRLAQEKRAQRGMEHQCQFINASFNHYPLPFEDESFDGGYNVQAFSYNQDKYALFKEIYRVLRPGAKFAMVDWVLLPDFDATNPEHAKHLYLAKQVIGSVDDPRVSLYEDAMRQAGFDILHTGDMSKGGRTTGRVIEMERQHFAWLRHVAKFLIPLRILPKSFLTLLERADIGVSSYIWLDEEGLATSSYQFVLQKPKKTTQTETK